MEIERLASGMYAVVREDGVRIAVKRTKKEARRYRDVVLKRRGGT